MLDTDVETGLRRNRRINKKDRLELEEVSFHENVRKGFMCIAEKEPGRVRLIDCSGEIDEVHEKVVSIIVGFLDKRKR